MPENVLRFGNVLLSLKLIETLCAKIGWSDVQAEAGL